MISPKQKKILAFPYTKYEAIICDGSIRAGKTMLMVVAFVDWAMREFNGQRFGICSKTVDAANKNIVSPYLALTYWKDKYSVKWRRTDKMLIVSDGHRENFFEVFGGRDESSFALIQGRTLAGVLLDEVVLMPQSFVNQALARCSVDGAKLWFSCNPGSPQHWFYNDWIKRHKERNALYLHFTMRDNPSLSESTLARYESMYSGVFYQRYILGQWILAEGLVYDFGEDNITDEIPEHGEYYMSIDYGTQNPFSCGLWCIVGDHATRIAEYYYCGRNEQTQKTDEEYCDEVERLADGYKIKRVVVDPSAASFIVALRKRGFYVTKANNDVLDGIRRVSGYLKDGRLKIHRSCGHTIEEFGLYRWDDKSGEDKVIKENDHCIDGDTLVDTLTGKRKISDLVGRSGFVWSYDEKRKRKCIRWFSRVRKTGANKPLLLITLENGKTLKCTPEHLILTDKGWLEAQYLNEKTKVVDVFAGIARVASVEIIPNADVYNMEVSGTHCFSVNSGIIIHNCMDETRYLVNTVLRHKSSKTDNTFWKEW